MRVLRFTLALAAASLLCRTLGAGAMHPAGALRPDVPRVLVYTLATGDPPLPTRRGPAGERSVAEQVLLELAAQTGAFEVVLTRDINRFEPASLEQFDAVFFFTRGEPPFDERQRKSLYDWVRAGGGFAAVASTPETWTSDPEFGELLGARIESYPWKRLVRLQVLDSAHPATAAVDEQFLVRDAIPVVREASGRDRMRVLLRLDPDDAELDDGSEARADREYPVAWSKRYGNGRVFYTALGGHLETWRDPLFLEHLTGGLRWTTGEFEASDISEAGIGLPEVRPGFRIELVAGGLEVRNPTALLCLTDGSLLVAEEAWGGAEYAEGPIHDLVLLRQEAGGPWNLIEFASGLFPVRGLAEADGTVVALESPRITGFHDRDGDGVAEARTVLAEELGPRAADGPGEFTTPAVSGLHFAIDGWLYFAAAGSAGARVMRMRPAGGEIEDVFLSGASELALGLDAQSELLAVVASDEPRPIHLVWGGAAAIEGAGTSAAPVEAGSPTRAPTAEQGSGPAPLGSAVVYAGGLWPEAFRGDLLVCESGGVRRYDLVREGAGFRVASTEILLRAGSAEFSPRALCVSVDGRFLYVADVARGGRIWRVSREDGATPMRPWGIDPRADLEHPSAAVRLAAARRLVARGESEWRWLRSMAWSGGTPDARVAALWAVAADPSKESTACLERLAERGPALIRAHALRALGERPGANAWRLARLADTNPLVRRQAAQSAAYVDAEAQALSLLFALRREVRGGDVALLATLRAGIVRAGIWDTVYQRLAGAEPALRDELLRILAAGALAGGDGSEPARGRLEQAAEDGHLSDVDDFLERHREIP